ncbi:hypothetical protein Droror1_Dr00012193, partial [Drosera rotundifolia]
MLDNGGEDYNLGFRVLKMDWVATKRGENGGERRAGRRSGRRQRGGERKEQEVQREGGEEKEKGLGER